MAQLADTGAPSIGLGNRRSAFTFLQLQELEHQALIYKYMLAGAPVPFHLVLPIWKSVVGSAGGIYKHHPSWLGSSSLYFDYRNNMEAEPGRCRRTDGKKWRCSKEVVPGQKYCERHMHRGRQRSRKPVEGPAPSINTTPTIQNAADSTTHLSISMPGGQPPTTTPATSFSPTSVLHPNTCKTEPSL